MMMVLETRERKENTGWRTWAKEYSINQNSPRFHHFNNSISSLISYCFDELHTKSTKFKVIGKIMPISEFISNQNRKEGPFHS